MDAVSSTESMGPQMFAMKKAVEVQEEAVLKVLESATQQQAEVDKIEVAKLTEKGQNIDFSA